MRSRSSLVAVFVLAFLICQVTPAYAKYVVTLKWEIPELTQIIQPDSTFKPGYKMTKLRQQKTSIERKDECYRNFAAHWIVLIGASGKEFATNSSKNITRKLRIVSADWEKDEYGEDFYKISYLCSGSTKISFSRSSSSYSFVFYNDVQGKRWFSGQSPFYSLLELRQNEWVVSHVAGKENCYNTIGACTDDIWVPSGTALERFK